MKKFIKDWWPVLLILVLFVLKASIKPKGKLELIIAGYKPTDNKCPVCGGPMYHRGHEGFWLSNLTQFIRGGEKLPIPEEDQCAECSYTGKS